MTPNVPRNGIGLWRGISATAIGIAVSAVAWNYAELHNLDLAVAHLADVGVTAPMLIEVRQNNADLKSQIAFLRAKQEEVLRRLDRLESLTRPSLAN